MADEELVGMLVQAALEHPDEWASALTITGSISARRAPRQLVPVDTSVRLELLFSTALLLRLDSADLHAVAGLLDLDDESKGARRDAVRLLHSLLETDPSAPVMAAINAIADTEERDRARAAAELVGWDLLEENDADPT